jgi:hypothetical protein
VNLDDLGRQRRLAADERRSFPLNGDQPSGNPFCARWALMLPLWLALVRMI